MEIKLEQKSGNIIKIVLFGPESTGKTTLARNLANHFDTHWVPEYMRSYLQKKWNEKKAVCTLDDLIPIANGQIHTENLLTQRANKLIFCDTNLLELKVYSELYYNGYCPPEIAKYAIKNEYDLYFLTYIDTPWVKDDLRDKPNERLLFFTAFKQTLENYNKPYILLKGTYEQRLKQAVYHVKQLLNS